MVVYPGCDSHEKAHGLLDPAGIWQGFAGAPLANFWPFKCLAHVCRGMSCQKGQVCLGRPRHFLARHTLVHRHICVSFLSSFDWALLVRLSKADLAAGAALKGDLPVSLQFWDYKFSRDVNGKLQQKRGAMEYRQQSDS